MSRVGRQRRPPCARVAERYVARRSLRRFATRDPHAHAWGPSLRAHAATRSRSTPTRFARGSPSLLRAVCDLHARVELCFAAAKQERDGDAFFELGDQRVDLLGAPGVDARPLADHCQDHVAGLNVATRVATDVLDEDTVV